MNGKPISAPNQRAKTTQTTTTTPPSILVTIACLTFFPLLYLIGSNLVHLLQ